MNKINRKLLAQNMSNFAKSKPGFDLCNYASYSGYKSDYNSYKKDADFNRRYASYRLETILDLCTDEEIYSAFRSFCGRLQFDENMELHYCTGQYYPVEYQAALKSVIKALLK